MAYFGSIFFAHMGGGGGQNYFQVGVGVSETLLTWVACPRSVGELASVPTTPPKKYTHSVSGVAPANQTKGRAKTKSS